VGVCGVGCSGEVGEVAARDVGIDDDVVAVHEVADRSDHPAGRGLDLVGRAVEVQPLLHALQELRPSE